MTIPSEEAAAYRITSVLELAVSILVWITRIFVPTANVVLRCNKSNFSNNDSGHPHFHSLRVFYREEYANNYSCQHTDIYNIFNFILFRTKDINIRNRYGYRKSSRPSNKRYVDLNREHRTMPNRILWMFSHTWWWVLQDIP
jgi:hypothetical protein